MKQIVKWGSPKEYQEPRTVADDIRDETEPARVGAPVKKRHTAKYCKFLKGPHQYGQWKPMIYDWNPKHDTGIWERYCIKCNRTDTWYAPHIPGGYFNRDLSARPPGYTVDTVSA